MIKGHLLPYLNGRGAVIETNNCDLFLHVYPEPQYPLCNSTGTEYSDILQKQGPKATGLSPWYGVYSNLPP